MTTRHLSVLARASRPADPRPPAPAVRDTDRTGKKYVGKRPDTVTTAQKLAGFGLLVLVAIMPFHAFLCVWLGSLTGQQTLIQAWKEVVIVAVTGLAAYMAWRRTDVRTRLRGALTWWALAFIVVGLAVTAIMRPSLVGVAYGIKTDYEAIVLLFVAMAVATPMLRRRATTIIITTGVIVAAFGVVHSYLLPADMLTRFGYGPDTVQAYQLVDPALSVIRSPSTLGGPNQLGAFLIVPLALVLARAIRKPRLWHAVALLAIAGGIWVSYSRAALLGALVAVILVIFMRLNMRQALVGAAILLTAGAASVGTILYVSSGGHDLQYYVFHSKAGSTDANNSTNQHALALLHSVELVMSRPFGDGLGTAGPASLRTDDRFISENYYLQLAIETGLVGLGAFVGLVVTVVRRLYRRRRLPEATAVLAALAGISVVNLFLHGWADSTLAIIFWILCGLWLVPLTSERSPATPAEATRA